MNLALIPVDPLNRLRPYAVGDRMQDPAELVRHAVLVASALVALAVCLAGRRSMN